MGGIRERGRRWLERRLTAFLERPVGHYERHCHNDVTLLKRHIRKGDVLLVEGDQRISRIIKYLTHSSWSHAALYVGDELVRQGGPLCTLAREHFGDEAEHLLVEAVTEGVVASPLAKYAEHNVRVCRPYRLRPAHLRTILDEAVAAIGWRYDLDNIVDLALHLVAASLLPSRRRRDALRFGSRSRGHVICTSLIGGLFHRVGFPVLPSFTPLADPEPPVRPPRRWPWDELRAARLAGLYRARHPTLLMPRDFDLSPYFEIVKFNVIKQRGFDYERIAWAEDPTSGDTR